MAAGVVIVPAPVRAATTINVPGDYSTIQAAIDAAADGDTVLVAPGTYLESIRFWGKAITVESSGGPDVTTIDAQSLDVVVRFEDGEGRDSIIRGFTITGGESLSTDPTRRGGGVLAVGADPTIEGNIITANCSDDGGHGVLLINSSSRVEANEITANNGDCVPAHDKSGGGIQASGGNPEVVDNDITSNEAYNGGGIWFNNTSGLISGNYIFFNEARERADGIYSTGSNSGDSLIVNNFVVRNWGEQMRGRGIVRNNTFYSGSGSAVLLGDGAVFVNNAVSGEGGPVVRCGNATISFNAVFNVLPIGLLYSENCGDRTGIDGNLNASPLFVNTNDDFHLRSDSPLIDAGTSSGAPLVDFDQDIRPNDGDSDGTASVDIGADEWTIPDTGVTGTVTDENSDPLGGLCARAWEGAFGKGAAGTRADGRYWIPLVAGSYSVEFWDCVAQVYDTQSYDNVPDKASATPVVVASGSLAEIDAGMSLTGISGVVTNGSTIPLPDVCVTVYDGAAALGNATTNSDGEYLALVPPGSYTTHFVGCEGGLYEAEWCDDAPESGFRKPGGRCLGCV